MPFNLTPSGPNLDDLPRYVEQELRRVTIGFDILVEAVQQLNRIAEINGIVFSMLWTDTTAGDPGTGNVGVDSVTWQDASIIRLSLTDVYGRVFPGNKLNVVYPLRVELIDQNTNRWHSYTAVSGTEFTGWVELNVVPVGGDNENPAAGARVDLRLIPEIVEVVSRF